MRYFAELAYNGTQYCGWQRQPNGISVQEKVETALSTLLRSQIEVTGCGRTDAGVHASQYLLHFDLESEFQPEFIGRLNRMLPSDIVLYGVWPVAADAHARFDAVLRSYEYRISLSKNPFEPHMSWHFPFFDRLDMDLVRQVAALLPEHTLFYPFCKSETDAKTMRCILSRSEWIFDEHHGRLVFHISADRFLRGMVRLIVGACLNAGLGQITVAEIREALERQTRIPKSWSVPPDGLFLTEVKYPYRYD